MLGMLLGIDVNPALVQLVRKPVRFGGKLHEHSENKCKQCNFATVGNKQG